MQLFDLGIAYNTVLSKQASLFVFFGIFSLMIDSRARYTTSSKNELAESRFNFFFFFGQKGESFKFLLRRRDIQHNDIQHNGP